MVHVFRVDVGLHVYVRIQQSIRGTRRGGRPSRVMVQSTAPGLGLLLRRPTDVFAMTITGNHTLQSRCSSHPLTASNNLSLALPTKQPSFNLATPTSALACVLSFLFRWRTQDHERWYVCTDRYTRVRVWHSLEIPAG